MALKKTPFQRTLANMTQQGTVDPADAEAISESKKKQMGGAAANTMVTTPTDTPPQGAAAGNQTANNGGAVNPTVSAGAGQVDNPTTTIYGSDTIEPAGRINKNYLMFGKPSEGFQSGMSATDKASWNAIGQKFAAGDQSWLTDTNAFRDNGNWGSFYDDNGNINGWLYAANGTGGYAPVFGGKVGETGYKSGDVFYSPDGKAYMMGPDGTLSQSGNVDWAQFGSYIGPQAGYQDSPFWVLENGQYKKYTTQTAPDSVLEAQGYYRTRDGLVLPIDEGYRLAKGVKTGQITPEQAYLAENGGGFSNFRGPEDVGQTGGNGYPFGGGNGGSYPYGGGGTGGGNGGGNGGTYPYGGGSDPTGNGGGNGSGGAQTTSFQDYLNQWDYGPPPEWNGSEYQTKENQHLQNAESIDWSESEYLPKALDLLEQSLQEYGGSEYEALVKELLQKYGEEWGGSDYQKKQDEHMQNAENMKFNYNPETDPVWQALQKQYRREGDRATRQTMGQAAAMTGGVPSSYAATAAAQAGNNYAAQLSDRLPEVYQNAYDRYLKEYERELGLADQYAGYDQTMYERWNDQQGKNMDLADAYNLLGEQDRQAFKDRMDQLAGGADAYFKLDQDAYGRKLDEYDRETGLADTYNKLVGRDRDWYNEDRNRYETDKEFEYGVHRDSVNDARYEEEKAYERAWNEEQRKYERWMDQVNLDFREREFAQQLLEYADSQKWEATKWEQYLREYGDQLTEREREWVYKMARDAVDDRRWETQYQQSLRAYDDGQKRQEFDGALNRLQTFGYVRAEDANILGAPAGTSLEDYVSGSGRSRGTAGKTKTAASRKDAAESSGTRRYGTHPDGRKRTEGYGELKTLLRNARIGGSVSRKQLSRMIDDWAARGRIEDYEVGILRKEFGLDSDSRRLAPR